MNPKYFVLEVIAVIAGAIIGVLVAGFLAWLFAAVPFATAMFTMRDYILALVVVAIFAMFYAKLDGTPAVLASLALGIVLPTIVERFAFGSTFSWLTLLLLNLAFAVAALSTYRFVHANGTVREVAGKAADH